MKLNVVIVHNTIVPYRLALFEELSNNSSIDLTVFYCAETSFHKKWYVPRSYRYQYKILPKIFPIFGGILGVLTTFNPTIFSDLLKARPDIIITDYGNITLQIAFFLGQLLRVPTVLWPEAIKEPKSILGRISRPMRMLFYRRADAVIVPGRLTKHYAIEMGSNTSKIYLAPNCMDNDLFAASVDSYKKRKNRIKKEMNIENDIIILYVGRIVKEKGVMLLLNVFERLRSEGQFNVGLVLVGYGSMVKTLKKYCKVNYIADVYFAGAITDISKLTKYYSIADIFVLPSFRDVWGFVINEAMVSGLPIISTGASQAGVEMIRSGKNGYLIRWDDHEELYRTIKKLVCNDDLRERMSRESREKATKEFETKHMANGFIEAIDYAIGFNRTCHRPSKVNDQ